MTMQLSHQNALLYVMIAMSSVDRAMTDDEFARIGEIVSKLPVFADCDDDELLKTAEACSEILSRDGGLQQALHLVREALPEKLRETAYWVALEVAAADRLKRPEEIRFLEMLRGVLELDSSATAAIERGIRARDMTL
jgi:tellurite resistance protein